MAPSRGGSRREHCRRGRALLAATLASWVELPARGRDFCSARHAGRQQPQPRRPHAAATRRLAASTKQKVSTGEARDLIFSALKAKSSVKKVANQERDLILYLRQSYKEANKNRDGGLTREDFVAWTSKDTVFKRLRSLGVQLPRTALGKAYDMLDVDGNGFLDEDEFVVGLSYAQAILSVDDRKQRFAIDAIVRHQEGVRTSVSLLSWRLALASAAALGLAGAASFAGLLPLWYSTCIPAGASALMLTTSVAESVGAWSKGSARYCASKASEQAYRGEVILAEADIDKALIPFGVGFTALAACAAGAVKVVTEQRNFFSQTVIADVFDVGDLLVVLLALAAVFGASATSDQSLQMRATLRSLEEAELFDDALAVQKGSSKLWMGRALRPVGKPAKTRERAVNAGATLLLCLLPLPFVQMVMVASDVPTFVLAVAVAVSEAAAAQAAITLFLAEMDFANVERRVAAQSKNAALAELFYAQTSAEVAVLPATTAVSGAALGGTSLFVEFSRWAAVASSWPAGVASLRSALGATLARIEAQAAWLQRGFSMNARQLRSGDVITSSIRELSNVARELEEDPTSDMVRADLQRLPVGMTRDFEALSREDRRKVHIVASELGMPSLTLERKGSRVLRVTNLGNRPEDTDPAGSFLEASGREFRELYEQGVPVDSRLAFTAAGFAGLTGAAAPFVAGKLGVELLTPLVTAAAALYTVQQERSGTLSSATASRYSAGIAQLLADANSLLARATMVSSVLPTVLGVATFATTISVAGFALPSGTLGLVVFYLAVLPALPVNLAAFLISVWRLRRTVKYVRQASLLVDARAPPCLAVEQWYWWPILASFAFLLPCDVFRQVALASAILTGGTGVMMAASAVQIAAGDNFAARSAVICACADAWAQSAAKAIRLLPFESATAVITAVLSSAFAQVSVALAVSFTLAGTAVCLRSLQLQDRAKLGMNEAKLAANSLQELSCGWPWKSRDRKASSPEPGDFVTLPTLPAWRILLRRLSGGADAPQLSRLWGEEVNKGKRNRLAEGRVPEQEFGPGVADITVQNVQRDFDELYIARNVRAGGFSGTLNLLAAFSVACLLVPVLSASLARVILPVAGSGLTLFTTAEESQVRYSVCNAKIRSSEISAVTAKMEVLLSATAPYRARLTVAVGLTAVGALMASALEHSAANGALQGFWFIPLIVVEAAVAAWCAWPLQATLLWSTRVRRMTSTLAGQPLEAMGFGRGSSAYGGPGFGTEPIALPPLRRLWPVLFSMPVLALAWLPSGRSLAQRAVGSTAAGAGVVAAALLAAELAAARAERVLATRATTYALTDAFANEGQQQSVVLPWVSATSVAFSGLITLLVELNPFSAAALTLLQTVTWVLASRKGTVAKYYSSGAMQVNAVTERPVR